MVWPLHACTGIQLPEVAPNCELCSEAIYGAICGHLPGGLLHFGCALARAQSMEAWQNDKLERRYRKRSRHERFLFARHGTRAPKRTAARKRVHGNGRACVAIAFGQQDYDSHKVPPTGLHRQHSGRFFMMNVVDYLTLPRQANQLI